MRACVQGWASVIGDAVELQFVLFLECTEQSGGRSAAEYPAVDLLLTAAVGGRPIRIGRQAGRPAGSHSVAAAECSALPERRAVQWPAHGGCEALRIGYTRQREAQRPLSYWQSTVRSSRAGALLCFALLCLRRSMRGPHRCALHCHV